MITRNLTSTYMKYRADHKQKKNRFAGSFLTENTSARLLSNQAGQSGGSSSSSSRSPGRGADDDIEMDVLPPQWMDVVGETQDNLTKIREKLTKLQQAQQKRLRQVFAPDSDTPDREIEVISTQISALFRTCEAQVRLIQTKGADLGITNKEYVLRQNAQRNLATQLQNLSGEFRMCQKSYLAGLKGRSNNPDMLWDDPNDRGSSLQQHAGQLTDGQLLQLEDVEFNVTHRNEEIKKIAQSVTELHTLFKEMAALVIDQGTMLDRIDYNVEQVVSQSREANLQLHKAKKAADNSRATKCIIFFVVGILIEIFLLMLKWG
ncbi:unnamed protein product [Amoebophrya sp. A25]|nr:unnamed protein product [Amoebophrya sp. A25]|eukprot:GSA25T00000598001.1